MAPFFQVNSDMLHKLERYCLANLGDLTVDLVPKFIMGTIYTVMLRVGDVEHSPFQEGDEGPYHKSEAKNEKENTAKC
jgi:hypothetical protein